MTSDASSRTERRHGQLVSRRAERRHANAAGARAERRRREQLRRGAFGLVVVAVLGAGIYLAANDFLGVRGSATTAEAIPVRLSMAGFTPAEVRIPAGQTSALELWTTDTAAHLQGGVHTLISDELGIREELPAAGSMGESRKVVQIAAPMQPGTYDIYCDTCCGGKASPTMHGRLVIEA